MSVIIRVLTGARAGHVLAYDGTSMMCIGREAGLELRFDPRQDLDVSARHATIASDGERLFVTDLQSLNGTYVNGRRIDAATPLTDGDQIAFGALGPVVEIRLIDAEHTAPLPLIENTVVATVMQSTDSRSAHEKHKLLRRTQRWRWTAIGLAVALCGAVGLTLVRWGESVRGRANAQHC